MTTRPHSSFKIVFILGLLAMLMPLSIDMYLPALPVMQVDLGVSASVAQLTITMTMLGMAVGQMLMGPLSDRYGRKRPLLLGMLGFTAAAVGCAAAESVPLFLAFRFLMGFSGASGIVIARAIARDVCKGPELTRFFAILMMVNGLAPVIAPVIGGQILLFSSWRGVFVLLIAVGLVQAGA